MFPTTIKLEGMIAFIGRVIIPFFVLNLRDGEPKHTEIGIKHLRNAQLRMIQLRAGL